MMAGNFLFLGQCLNKHNHVCSELILYFSIADLSHFNLHILFFFPIISFIYFWLCCVFVVVWAFSNCGVRASH